MFLKLGLEGAFRGFFGFGGMRFGEELLGEWVLDDLRVREKALSHAAAL